MKIIKLQCKNNLDELAERSIRRGRQPTTAFNDVVVVGKKILHLDFVLALELLTSIKVVLYVIYIK